MWKENKDSMNADIINETGEKFLKKIVLMFPGQGSQYTGMVKQFLMSKPEYIRYYRISGEVFGENIIDIVNDKDGKGIYLNDTRYSQIAIYTLSCMINDFIFKELKLKKENIYCAIGHSLGDYGALYSCGAYDFITGAKIVVFRSKLMSEISNSGDSTDEMGMAAVIGSDFNTVRNVLRNYKNRVFIANFNDYHQIVISGYKDDLLHAGEEIKKIKAKRIIPLNVNVASHCPLMLQASRSLFGFLKNMNINFNNLIYEFFSSTIAGPAEKNKLKDILVEQLIKPVRWTDSMEKIIGSDIRVFIEIGPGKVLSGLVKRILNQHGKDDIPVFNTDSMDDIENLVGFLSL